MSAPDSILLVASIAIAVHGAFAAFGARKQRAVKIGVAVPLSGHASSQGRRLLNGVLLAAKELNASGFSVSGNPTRVEVLVFDDRDDGDTASNVARELVERDVVAVIGHASERVRAARGICERAGVVYLHFPAGIISQPVDGTEADPAAACSYGAMKALAQTIGSAAACNAAAMRARLRSAQLDEEPPASDAPQGAAMRLHAPPTDHSQASPTR